MRAFPFPGEVTMRASERSAFYGSILEPAPPPSLDVTRAAHGRKAQTACERDEQLARKQTTPAPRVRTRGRAVA